MTVGFSGGLFRISHVPGPEHLDGSQRAHSAHQCVCAFQSMLISIGCECRHNDSTMFLHCFKAQNARKQKEKIKISSVAIDRVTES